METVESAGVAAVDSSRAAKTASLSDEERRRIVAEFELREELREELGKTLARGDAPPPERPRFAAGALLNSPFVITILGGILLAILGAFLQHRSADIENDRAYVRTVREKKYEMLRTFFADLDFQLRCNAWLMNTLRSIEQRERSRAADLNGAYNLQKLKAFQDIHQLYLKTPQASAYADQINALFPSTDVHDKMERFLSAQAAAVAEAGKLAVSARPDENVEDKAYALVTERVRKPRLDLLVAMQEDIKYTTAEGR
jgi:hypothetical protein